MSKTRIAARLSPLGLLSLTACVNSDTSIIQLADGSYFSVAKGVAYKGLLNKALVYIDYDDASIADSATVRTDQFGNYTLATLNNNYTIVVVTDGSTIDKSTGAVLSGVTLKAPSGATVVTATTTLMEEGNLTGAQLNDVLGLGAHINPLYFNPFASGVNAADALAVEIKSHQIMAVVNGFSAAIEGSGASQEDAFKTALKAVVDVITTKAGASGQIDLTNSGVGGDLTTIKGNVSTALTNGVTNADLTSFTTMADDTATAIKNVNDKIATVADLTSDTSKNIFSTTGVLTNQIKTAVSAEKTTVGSGDIDFKSVSDVNTAATNKTPIDITMSSNSISEASASLTLGTLSTVDDQASTTFTYAIAEAAGTDWQSFNLANGVLSLKSQPDFETKPLYKVSILSTDEGGKTFSKSIEVSVTDANDAPTVSNAIADQTFVEDVPISYTFDSNVFSDVDAGDTLTYVATLSNGSVLSFPTFNAATRTFTGTALNAHVGTHTVKITATDTSGASVYDTFDITITNANDTPTVAYAIADQTIAEDSALSFQFNANTFADIDVGDSFTYTATLADGTALPSWLSFNASTRTFSGTPLNGNVGAISVKVMATDSGSAIVSDTFNITVTNTNDGPTVANAIANQTVAEDSALSFQFNTNVFSDADAGDTLTYTATLPNGNSLPSWLSFNASTRTFTGTPTNSDVSGMTVLSVKVTATDSGSATVSDTFSITVTNTNDAPTVANAIADQTATSGTALSYQFNANVFADIDVSDTLTYTATLANGSALPSWLSFNASTRTFSGTPADGDAGAIAVKVTATDSGSATVFDTFSLTVSANAAPASVALSSNTVAENAAGGTVGTLSASDADGDTITYSLASGGDNNFFEISGTTLKFKNSVTGNYEANNSYSITVNASDGTTSTALNTLINVTNVNEANASTHTSKADTASSETLNSGNDAAVENLMSGRFWGAAGSGIDLNYSFMGTGSQFKSGYDTDSGGNHNGSLETASVAFKATVANIFNDFSSVSLLNFAEVADNGSSVGHIRFGTTEINNSAFAWIPFNNAVAGDVWLNDTNNNYNNAALLKDGTYHNTTITHEIGHALGLSHTQDAATLGGKTYGTTTTTGSIHNSNPYSTMSYAEWNGDNMAGITNGTYRPTTLMIDDIAALQHLYGVNEQYKTGDDVYTLGSFDGGTTNDNHIYATIWDAGGTDTISWASQSTVASINLNAGSFSCFGNISGPDDSDLGSNSWTAGDGILGIAHNVVIENAKGGSGVDTIVGNSAANILYGGTGAGIVDNLTGGGGADTFVCVLSDANTSAVDLIADFTNGTDLIGLEDRTFSDLTITGVAMGGGNHTLISDTASSKKLFFLQSVDASLIDGSDFVVTDFV